MLAKKKTNYEGERLKTSGIELYFIINPVAQNEGSGRVWKKMERVLASKNISYQSFFTEYKGHAKELSEEILAKTDKDTLIAAVGGDGTLHEVMNGAAGYPHAIIACIPAGSGNDYVRGIQRTKNCRDALSLIMQPENYIKEIDIGILETNAADAAFINSVGIGIDAEITYDVNHSAWKILFNFFKIGKLIYIYFFLKKLFTYKRTDMAAFIDGKEHVFKRVWFIVAANQPYFGGGINISPKSRHDDSLFEVIAVHDIPTIKLLSVFVTVLWGGHLRLKNVDSFTCRHIEIISADPVRIQADGEILGDTKLSAFIAPNKIRVLTRGK
ncbi:diacylglycerol/lipid kinase family protein [Peribacillus glennii]|nr:diacylglycerol kinase family protein [Peribacillus glennii]